MACALLLCPAHMLSVAHTANLALQVGMENVNNVSAPEQKPACEDSGVKTSVGNFHFHERGVAQHDTLRSTIA